MLKSFSQSELASLLAEARRNSESDYLLFRVCFNHGLRISEALAITKDNIKHGRLILPRLKGSNPVDHPLLDEKEALEKMAATVVGRFFKLSRVTAWRRMQKYCAAVNISPTKARPHSLKHSCGRLAYKAGVGIPELQAYLGHVNANNSLRYMQASNDEACQAFAAATGRIV